MGLRGSRRRTTRILSLSAAGSISSSRSSRSCCSAVEIWTSGASRGVCVCSVGAAALEVVVGPGMVSVCDAMRLYFCYVILVKAWFEKIRITGREGRIVESIGRLEDLEITTAGKGRNGE